MGNWRFFAVTYDSTLASGHVKFYFGSSTVAATLDVARDYARGAVGASISRLCIGHFNVATRAGAQDRMFRGLIDEVKVFGDALALEQIQQVQVQAAKPGIAKAPNPADLAQDVPADAVLSWGPGAFAKTHDVYFGTNFVDVNTAGRQNPKGVLANQGQSDTTYDPAGLLAFGQTYCWRIDEVNAAPDNTIFKGNVWSFTAEPYAYPVKPAKATASSAQPGMGPEKTIDESGLVRDLHGTEPTTMWLTTGTGPNWIQYEFDKAYKLHDLQVWNSNQLIEPFLGLGAKTVTVETSLDGTIWAPVVQVPEFAKATGTADYAANTKVSLGGIEAKHVRLTITASWSGVPSTGLSEVRFSYVPVQARAPQPANGAAGVGVNPTLDWRPGREATTHRVFFGTDTDAVAQETAPAQTVTDHSYAPATLNYATKYYWRVDEVGAAATYPGAVWSFTTANYAVIDDFESYNDVEPTRIFDAWLDGFGTTTNGSQVGNTQAPFAEKTIRRGSQSMPLTYDNSGGKVSEATRTFADARNWVGSGIKSLSLYFYGAPANTGQLYVKINNVKVLYNGSATDLKRKQWQPWNIDLSTVGVPVDKVTKLTLGVEGAGAAGKLYIDDIRLYPKTPELLTPTEPAKTGLLAEYLFDNGANDTSGNGHHGTFLGNARVLDSFLVLDGTDDAVAIPRMGGATATHKQCTYSMWMNSVSKPSSSGLFGGINFDGWSAGGIHCKLNNGRANAGINGLAGGDLNGTTVADADEWVHLALTVTDNVATVYLNGQGEASRTFTTPLTMILGKGCVGAWNNNGDIQRELKGRMDDVRIYNRAVSLEELLWLAGRREPVNKPL
jgi:hypothetical protein